jgi:hypothetical protein
MTKAMEYMKKTLSAAQYDRHVQYVVDWIDSYVKINNYDFDDKVMSYEQFFDLRYSPTTEIINLDKQTIKISKVLICVL